MTTQSYLPRRFLRLTMTVLAVACLAVWSVTLLPVPAEAGTLVPELDGGLFDRFDLSFDAKKVVFGYKKKGGPFRIYEIDLDPKAGKMIPGSLRQLTSGGDDEAEIIKCNDVSGRCSTSWTRTAAAPTTCTRTIRSGRPG